jgi:hypothetical protein
MTCRTLIALLLALCPAVSGCDMEACESCAGAGGSSGSTGTAGGAACTSTKGELHGTVSLFAPPGEPDSQPSPGALLDLRQKPEDVPLHVPADDSAAYTVELTAGDWIVGGDNADMTCKTFMPKTVTVVACESTALDVVLEACVN